MQTTVSRIEQTDGAGKVTDQGAEIHYKMTKREFVEFLWGALDGERLPEDGEGVELARIYTDGDGHVNVVVDVPPAEDK